MKETILKTPLSESQARSLRINEKVYLSGRAYQILFPATYYRILGCLKKGYSCVDGLKLSELTNSVICHEISYIEKVNNRWKLQYLGALPSSEYAGDKPVSELVNALKVRAVVGKGGLGKKSLNAMRGVGCVYLAQPGGVSAYFTKRVDAIEGVYLKGLGRIVVYQLKEFGPLFVTMDSHGNNIYERVEMEKKKALRELLK